MELSEMEIQTQTLHGKEGLAMKDRAEAERIEAEKSEGERLQGS